MVVTNPDGLSGILTAGYTYDAVSLSVSSNGRDGRKRNDGELGGAWGALAWDWVGLFKVETRIGSTAGTIIRRAPPPGRSKLTAPSQAGRYEFRYLLDDRYLDVAREVLRSQSPLQLEPWVSVDPCGERT